MPLPCSFCEREKNSQPELRVFENAMPYIVLLIFFILTTFSTVSAFQGESIQEVAFQSLDKIREEKKQQLLTYLERLARNAAAISSDELMLEFFEIKSKYYRLKKSSPPPAELEQLIEGLKAAVRDRYLHDYLLFYDILFIDRNGDIFHTIRRQGDYHRNIFEGELAKTSLSRQLKSCPGQTFVDYELYIASDEPSAFFVEPFFKEGVLTGWFVLQFAINKINNMFTAEKGLGVTGEVFLVNRQQYMLTESRFSKNSSILNQHLSRENIEAKFRERSGHKVVVDYRGFRALTSFEVCTVGNSEWLLIAKIDASEIVTEQYRKKPEEFQRRMARAFQKQKIAPPCTPMRIESKVTAVDMDDFRKVDNEELLCTYGVSTCTAIIVTFPGKFAYMGHISNLDVAYGGNATDLVGHIFKRIKTFDIYEYERRKLMVTVIANHLDSVLQIIDKLVAQGLFLSQIKFLYAESEYGNVLHDYLGNRTLVEWRLDKKTGRKISHCASSVDPVGEVVKTLIGYK